eukprot:6126545-Amphidinium_carterae.1
MILTSLSLLLLLLPLLSLSLSLLVSLLCGWYLDPSGPARYVFEGVYLLWPPDAACIPVTTCCIDAMPEGVP